MYGGDCAGQGGNDLLGNRQQNGEQQLRLGNLALVSLPKHHLPQLHTGIEYHSCL